MKTIVKSIDALILDVFLSIIMNVFAREEINDLLTVDAKREIQDDMETRLFTTKER